MARAPQKTASPGAAPEQLREKLQALAGQLAAELSAMEAAQSKELLSDFVSELFLSVAEQTKRRERLEKQAAGIAQAKARGVRFGRPGSALPDNFDQVHRDWRQGKLTLHQAAEACGMREGTFYGAAARKEQSAG